MKKNTKIRFEVDGSRDSRRLIQKLNKLIPENNFETSFSHWFSDGDPRLEIVKRHLHDAGWISEHEAYESGRTDCYIYSHFSIFEYDHEDIAPAPYATMFPTSGLKTRDIHVSRDQSGRLAFQDESPLPITDIAVASSFTPIMTTEMKRQIEHQGWKHMVIRSIKVPQMLVEKAAASEHRKLPRWELNSDLELPPIHPAMRRIHFRDSMPFTGDRRKGCLVLPSKRFPVPALHYRASDLKHVDEFDIARTWEWFTNGKNEDMRKVVVSKRVYEFFRELDVKNAISWDPVYVIEDE